MSNVVEIVVRQRTEGTAIRDAARETEELRKQSMEQTRAEYPATVAKIKQLYTAAGVYETNGDAGMAKSARADARLFEKDLERASAERFASMRGITQEHKEQSAVAKAQETHMRRLGRAGANLLENAAGASPFGGVTSALGAIGGPAGLAVGVAAGIGTAIAAAFSKQGLASDLLGLSAAANRSVQARHLNRAAGFEGSSGGSREEAESFRDKILQLDGERTKLEREAKFRFFDLGSWRDHLTGATGNALRENSDQRQLAEEGERRARQTQRQKFAEEGALEIQAHEKRASYDMREARELERKVAWRREYKRLMLEGATPEEAAAGAQAKDTESRHAEAMMFGRLVNARSGAGDIARAAALASGGEIGGRGGHHAVERAVEKQTDRMTEHHNQTVSLHANAGLKVPALKRPGQQNAEILAKYGS